MKIFFTLIFVPGRYVACIDSGTESQLSTQQELLDSAGVFYEVETENQDQSSALQSEQVTGSTIALHNVGAQRHEAVQVP